MKWKQSLAALVALAAITGTAWFGWQSLQVESAGSVADTVGFDESALVRESDRIHLSETVLAEAGIATETVSQNDLQIQRTLPARFAYDDTKHIAIRTPTDGVLQSILVKVGDTVGAGQVVAILRSPSIGEARNRVLTAQSELALANKAARWERDIRDGVRRLVEAIKTGPTLEQLKAEVGDQTVGDHGGKLMTAYSKAKLASKNAQSIERIGNTGAISGRVVRERQSDQQLTASSLEAAIEQSIFETEQALLRADSDVAHAQRKVDIAKQTLTSLLGSVPASNDEIVLSLDDPDVARLEICSPISGTVERKTFSATERVTAQDELFIVADTTRLWVEADIRGRDWSSIRVIEGDTVTVSVPSVELPPQPAKVDFIGRQVDPQSGSVPLVASIDNSDGRFRPGHFARVSVPTQVLPSVISVPRSAVIDLDGQQSVFVQDGDDFVPTAVVTGQRNDARIEIRSGIQPGQSVVVQGAFLLKSELLLEGEE